MMFNTDFDCDIMTGPDCPGMTAFVPINEVLKKFYMRDFYRLKINDDAIDFIVDYKVKMAVLRAKHGFLDQFEISKTFHWYEAYMELFEYINKWLGDEHWLELENCPDWQERRAQFLEFWKSEGLDLVVIAKQFNENVEKLSRPII